MAFDEELANRLREIVQDEPGVREMRMFGGLAFLVGGHMAVAASGKGGLMLRVDPSLADSLVDGVHVDRFEMHGRRMGGWLRVDPAAIQTDEALRRWAAYGMAYVRTLPPKA